MSKNRDIRDYLVDMMDAVRSIRDFTAGITYEDFCSDKKTLYAVVMAFEILGEAAKHVDEPTRLQFPSSRGGLSRGCGTS